MDPSNSNVSADQPVPPQPTGAGGQVVPPVVIQGAGVPMMMQGGGRGMMPMMMQGGGGMVPMMQGGMVPMMQGGMVPMMQGGGGMVPMMQGGMGPMMQGGGMVPMMQTGGGMMQAPGGSGMVNMMNTGGASAGMADMTNPVVHSGVAVGMMNPGAPPVVALGPHYQAPASPTDYSERTRIKKHISDTRKRSKRVRNDKEELAKRGQFYFFMCVFAVGGFFVGAFVEFLLLALDGFAGVPFSRYPLHYLHLLLVAVITIIGALINIGLFVAGCKWHKCLRGPIIALYWLMFGSLLTVISYLISGAAATGKPLIAGDSSTIPLARDIWMGTTPYPRVIGPAFAVVLFIVSTLIYCICGANKCANPTLKLILAKTDVEALNEKIRQKREAKPKICFKVRCFHSEKRYRTVTDSDGDSYREKYYADVTSFEEVKEFEYGTWFDASGDFKPKPGKNYVNVNFSAVWVQADPETTREMNRQLEEFSALHRQKDEKFTASIIAVGLTELGERVTLTVGTEACWASQARYQMSVCCFWTLCLRGCFDKASASQEYAIIKRISIKDEISQEEYDQGVLWGHGHGNREMVQFG